VEFNILAHLQFLVEQMAGPENSERIMVQLKFCKIKSALALSKTTTDHIGHC
jgi:hypothetical protein